MERQWPSCSSLPLMQQSCELSRCILSSRGHLLLLKFDDRHRTHFTYETLDLQQGQSKLRASLGALPAHPAHQKGLLQPIHHIRSAPAHSTYEGCLSLPYPKRTTPIQPTYEKMPNTLLHPTPTGLTQFILTTQNCPSPSYAQGSIPINPTPKRLLHRAPYPKKLPQSILLGLRCPRPSYTNIVAKAYPTKTVIS